MRDDMRLEVELKGLIATARRIGRHDLYTELKHLLELHRAERVSRQRPIVRSPNSIKDIDPRMDSPLHRVS